MPALFVFLLKVNIALLLFCAGYYLVLRHLTFYTLNRVYLLAAIVFASVYPQINFSDFVQRHQELVKPVEQVAFNWQYVKNQSFIKPLSQPDYWHWVSIVFWIGAAVLSVRLIVQLVSLLRLYKRSKPAVINNHHVRVMDKDAAPFSFWQSIFVNPDKHEPSDLNSILLHEQVHVNQWHTADILLAELSSIFYWFNPGIWLIKKAIRENIEFITDQKILNKGVDSKAYQYSLVSVSFNNTQPSIVNHFNISTIKKRIIMMNAKRSSKLNLTRYAFLVPAVVALLLVFSVSKADLVKPIKISFTNAVRPLAKMADITFYPTVSDAATPVQEAVDSSKMTVIRPKPMDTTAAHVIIKNDTNDSTVVYINGKKGDSKNLNPTDIVAVYVLHGQEAAPYLNEKLADNIKAAVIITKDSPEGEALKQKLDRRPRSKVFTFTKLNTISGKGTVSEVLVNGMPAPVITNATAAYTSDSLIVSPSLTSRIVAVTATKAGRPATIVVTGSNRTGGAVALRGYGYSTPINSSKFVLVKRDSTQTDPKLYIDGKESPMSELKNIEPDMIESINVVKDSIATKGDKKKAAGALYIVTKKKKE